MVSPILIIVAAIAGLASGTAPGPVATGETAVGRQASEQEAVYRRESFVYPSDAHRDPFESPIREGVESEPMFEDLDLVGIIFGGPLGSVAMVIDRASEKRYRVRRGDTIGNVQVLEIQPNEVVVRVTEFGVTRGEKLSLGRAE